MGSIFHPVKITCIQETGRSFDNLGLVNGPPFDDRLRVLAYRKPASFQNRVGFAESRAKYVFMRPRIDTCKCPQRGSKIMPRVPRLVFRKGTMALSPRLGDAGHTRSAKRQRGPIYNVNPAGLWVTAHWISSVLVEPLNPEFRHTSPTQSKVMDPAQTFCDVCICLVSYLQRIGSSGATFLHHTSWESFMNAAAAGCLLCKRWLENASWMPINDQDLPVKNRTLLVRTINQGLPVAFWLIVCNKEHTTFHSIHPFCQLTTAKSESGSQESFQFARFWLSRCLQEHGSCRKTHSAEETSWKPTRLVSVRGSGKSRLVERSDMPSRLSYLSLSHCWGKITNKTTLTTSNIESFRLEIPLSPDEKTLVDAIEVTRQLGFDYIWIDSLCIIQDSREDWRRESSQMADVYRFSSCNISALSASDDFGGCFFKRDIDTLSAIRIEFAPSGESSIMSISGHKFPLDQSTFALDGLWGKFDLHWRNEWVYQVELAPLHFRAWVVQERVLARRILHFGEKQLLWECNEMNASESFPYGFDSTLLLGDNLNKSTIAYYIMNRSDNSNRSNTHEIGDSELRNVLRAWGDIIYYYSRCSLTKGEDKLVAISAVAKVIQPIIGARYLAGHWEYDFIPQLAWSTAKPCRRTDLTAYRCPTWSWAAVDGQILKLRELYNEGRRSIPLAQLLGAQIDYVTEDEGGEVKGGHIVVRGQLLNISCVFDNKKKLFDENGRVSHWKVSVNGSKSMMFLTEDFEVGPLAFSAKYTCFPLEVAIGGKITLKGKRGWHGLHFHSIVLDRVEGRDKTFRRIGYLGSSYTGGANSEEFEEDPLVRAVGMFSEDPNGDYQFTRHAADLVDFTII